MANPVDTYFANETVEVSGISSPSTTNVVFTSLFNELAQDNISAAGSTQSGATQLTAQTSRISTVTAGQGVALPISAAGLELLVINHGANAVQVYGNNTEGAQIDDIATGTGVTQMPNSLVIYTCASAGKWYSEGLATGYGGSGLQTVSFQDSISAAGSTQGTATVLAPRMMTNVTTVGSGQGVLLPASAAGLQLAINNNQGTNALLVYPNGTDKINALSASAGFSQAANTVTIYYCFTAGQWFTK